MRPVLIALIPALALAAPASGASRVRLAGSSALTFTKPMNELLAAGNGDESRVHAASAPRPSPTSRPERTA